MQLGKENGVKGGLRDLSRWMLQKLNRFFHELAMAEVK